MPAMRIPTILPLLLLLAVMVRAAEPEDPHRPILLNAEQAFVHDKPDEALQLVNGYIEKVTTNPRAYLLRGAIHDHAKRYAKSLADYTKALELDAKLASAWQRRGVANFMLGQPKEAVADFDKYLELEPEQKPHHWQRGIALYYLGRFADGVRQFELHRTVNPDDVENATWHFLCMARAKDKDAARAALIPIKGDDRVPMMKLHEFYAGKATADDVLAAAKEGDPPAARLNRHLFYAHLYLGLYYEATGDLPKAKEHLTLAAEKYVVPDYMHGVAKAHVKLLK